MSKLEAYNIKYMLIPLNFFRVAQKNLFVFISINFEVRKQNGCEFAGQQYL